MADSSDTSIIAKQYWAWIIPLILVLLSVYGELYLVQKRIDILADEYKSYITFRQKVEDKLQILDAYCCGELDRDNLSRRR